MKLAISNIAWTRGEETAVAEKLQELGVKNIEIAPTKVWAEPTEASTEDIKAYLAWWAKYDISISAFQSMLFSRPDLKLFESEKNREETYMYMSQFLDLASDMGATRLVFGSPKNRQRGDVPIKEANLIAVDFFSRLGDAAEKAGVILCLEPNAPQYDCDFITNAAEGAALVRSVGSSGFGLHLDTACMALAGNDIGASIKESRDILKHFHTSSPMLEQVEARSDINHTAAAKALNDIGYHNLVSIEMRPGECGKNVERIEKAVKFTQFVYGIPS